MFQRTTPKDLANRCISKGMALLAASGLTRRGTNCVSVNSVRRLLSSSIAVSLLVGSCSSSEIFADGDTLKAGPFRLDGHTDTVDLLLLLDEHHLISGGYDGAIRVWDLTKPGQQITLEGDNTPVQDILVLDDGRVVTSNFDNLVRVWDLNNPGDPVVYSGHDWVVSSLAQLKDGRIASAGSAEVHVWNPDAPDEDVVILANTSSSDVLLVLDSGDLLVGGFSTLDIWSDDHLFGQPNAVIQTSGSVGSMLQLEDGRVALATRSGVVQIVDPAASSGEILNHDTQVDGWIRGLVLLPDGRLSFATDNGLVSVWDFALGDGPEAILTLRTTDLEPIWDLVAIGDSRLAGASSDNVVWVWNVATPNAQPHAYPGHHETVRSLVLLSDGRLVSAGQDTVIQVWDPADF